MATAAIRMSLMTGRAVPRACFARTSTTTTSTITPGSRRFLTASSPAKNAQANSSKAAGEQQRETMDWNTYFALRKTRRNYERAFMVPSALVSLLGAGYYFAQRDFDPTPIFGMDQVIVYGIGTVAAGLVGLAMGPVIGNSVFRAANSRAKPLVDRMDTEFLKHIARNRADPAANSISNPIPDYYGEKIKSVSEYRSWLRKQREFRRKSTFYV
ncbi:TIM23 complex component [Linnemannia schmuckeri]|uniref:Presequence translocated-associated motor subunit PAM17 n=1 Tax=Linnemannia schmuckeri TaxID=64567 RepID=A0A9P5S7G6_9FUNG|nr:TIM23 complex component [Linnemannia schmuckeri]